MKNKTFHFLLLVAFLAGAVIFVCKKDSSNDSPTVTVPTVTTTAVNSITQTEAKSGGSITADGGATVTARGICWNTSSSPTISNNKTSNGSGTGDFTGSLTGLTPNTKYYVRAYATNSAGTGYGNEQSFTTSPLETVTDIDGNVYHVIKIGNQKWMVENLKTTHYRNGDPIPNVTGSQWNTLTTGACCAYNDNPSNTATYGLLYNFYAATDSRNIAPTGWHIPTNEELDTITEYLGGWLECGNKMKEAGTAHWMAPNQGATNASGLTALPGGRNYDTGFEKLHETSYWWSSSQPYGYGFAWMLNYDLSSFMGFGMAGDETWGCSIRLIKD
ncbi:MAG: hypothetical protein NTU44_02195 [Bacteroidetes bacterium]|nr:hypothetical protein [Bacteroidota bacterium]